jgi:hypothetical protein
MAVAPGPGKPEVIFAVYGGLRDGKSDKAEAEDRKDALQEAINKAATEVVKIDNHSLGPDPARKVKKQFGALVKKLDGKTYAFACMEGETIDFT